MTDPSNPITVATDAIAIARAMRNLGRLSRSITKYEEALAAVPDNSEILGELLDVLEAEQDWAAVADRCAEWLAIFPDHATHRDAGAVHTRRIDALHRLGGSESAFAAYDLEPVARTEMTIQPDALLCVLGVRNESRRLPAFLAHHRRLGIGTFLVVDNGSDDDTLGFLLAQPDTVVWSTTSSYRGANCGAAWWDLLLRRYAQGNWCLILDADEHLVFPGHDPGGLASLCADLDAEGATCYPTVSLDMYPQGPLSEAIRLPDQDPLELFPYFDRNWYRRRLPFAGPRHNLVNHWGGVRARVLGGRDLGGFLLDKMPLFRHRSGETIMSGNHWLDRPSAEISDARGVLLHFKYDADFTELVETEAARGEHAGGARTYRQMAAELAADPDPTFFDPVHSIRYESPEQLVRFDIMRTRAGIARSRSHKSSSVEDRVPVPPIRAVGPSPSDAQRPLVSIVVPDRADDTIARISSALDALADQPFSEILVVTTAGSRTDRAPLPGHDLHRIVPVTTTQNLTVPETINLGIERSSGVWVHVVDHGWRVPSDAYDALAPLLRSAPGVGSTEVIATAIDPLDLDLDLAPAEVILRRDRLTDCGGLAPSIAAASTWELVQRAVGTGRSSVTMTASAEPVAGLVSAAPIGFGEDITHRLDAIARAALARPLDAAQVADLLDRCADDALRVIVTELEAARPSSAFVTLTEILRVPISSARREALLDVIGRRIR